MSLPTRKVLPFFAAALLTASAQAAGLSVDESTGEAHYNYTLSMPAARGRYQPNVTLRYGSSNRTDNGAGFGWAVSGDWIEVYPFSFTTTGYETVYVHNGTRRPLIDSSAVARPGEVADVDDDDVHMTF